MTEKNNNQLAEFIDALLSVNRIRAKAIFMESKAEPIQLIEKLVLPALQNVGEGWMQGNVALSQVYMSARIFEDLIELVLPANAPDRKSQPKMATVVLEDHHGLGKRIIDSILRASGFELLDYVMGIKASDLINKVEKDSIEIILISTFNFLYKYPKHF